MTKAVLFCALVGAMFSGVCAAAAPPKWETVRNFTYQLQNPDPSAIAATPHRTSTPTPRRTHSPMPSEWITVGSIKPYPTRVTRIMEKVRKRIRLRCAKGWPLESV